MKTFFSAGKKGLFSGSKYYEKINLQKPIPENSPLGTIMRYWTNKLHGFTRRTTWEGIYWEPRDSLFYMTITNFYILYGYQKKIERNKDKLSIGVTQLRNKERDRQKNWQLQNQNLYQTVKNIKKTIQKTDNEANLPLLNRRRRHYV